MRFSKKISRYCPFNVLLVRNHTSNNNKKKKNHQEKEISPLQFPCRLFLSPPPPCIFCIYPGVLVGGGLRPHRGRILERYWDKSLNSFPPCYSQSPLQTDFTSPPHPPPPPRAKVALKVPKCEIFHLFDFNDFYGIKSL
jgi:hypothetical protein